jgi:DMSO/TMAO reductase YedYZ molybdopterin-dependent catalytic subunit
VCDREGLEAVTTHTPEAITLDELALAARNHGMPLEALRYPVTPVGLHYLLTHYDIPHVDAASWRLAVDGCVASTLELTLEDIRSQPAHEVVVTMECAGNGRARLSPRPLSQPWLDEAVGTARWRGVPLANVLAEAGVTADAVEVVFTGLDRGVESGVEQSFQRSLTLEEARREEVLLAYEVNGQPLPPQHGFPLRLVVPGWYGMTNVKWLTAITLTDRPFAGPQQVISYRLRRQEDEEGVPLARMLPRALMVPPGIPDFPARLRSLEAGPCLLEGRAWSGFAPVQRVQVSTDGGAGWADAELDRDVDSPWAWCRWTHAWEARPGEAALLCRATDAAGNEQPLAAEWNLGGYANNAVQRVRVTVV